MREAIEASSVLQIDDENPDIVIAIGGDGTLMSAFYKYFDQIDHIGFVGIHTGQLVFYTWHELIIEKIIETLSQDKIPMISDKCADATVELKLK
ncbi:NAD(+)/NADH kinase [Lactobacillus kitasatonis]|uniref:NAD(+)/NADH kinase n=1 Tax=Lactobacillus kitasatonis TaxID=237446 RepID=UPI001F5E347B|nr:NAD(+)/NADH kinase [Lactobacillus kitasatonis]